MKRIRFDNIGGNWKMLILIVLSLIFILAGAFEVFEFENPNMNKYISGIGFFMQVIYWSKMFWYKNYVQWNKKGIVIRIKSVLGKSLRFDEIRTTELNEKTLTITKFSGKKIQIDLNQITEADSQRLNKILVENTIANNNG